MTADKQELLGAQNDVLYAVWCAIADEIDAEAAKDPADRREGFIDGLTVAAIVAKNHLNQVRQQIGLTLL